jgi:hypothetical protein
MKQVLLQTNSVKFTGANSPEHRWFRPGFVKYLRDGQEMGC